MRKKVGIITVCISENFGSVLQATALKEYLEKHEYDPVFISTRNSISSHSIKSLLSNVFKAILKGGMWDSIKKWIKKYLYFEQYIKNNFDIISKRKVSGETLNCILIGSDTVWDIQSKYFCASQDTFWALDWFRIPIIVYSASIANSDYNALDKLQYPRDAIKKYKCISARDEYTANYVSKVTEEKCLITCDPTLLLPREYYQKRCTKIEENYILVYMFDDLSGEWLKEVKKISKQNSLKIICIDKYISGSDTWLDSTMNNFFTYFSNAKYIITNTFHGTIFSIIFEKQFVCLDFNKSKVNELLHQVKLEDRLCSRSITEIIYKNIDYTEARSEIMKLKQESELYLLKSLRDYA